MIEAAQKLLDLARKKKVMIAIAESCTGGMVGSAITSISGSSEIFDRGFITYSYDSKTQILGVPQELIMSKGAVSQEVAEQMVIGAIKHSNAQLAVAITGIAGPTGGTSSKPVGLVYIATKYRDKVRITENFFDGDRDKIRTQAAIKAIELMLEELRQN
jgi:PncC family amidohydrolase